MMIKDERQKGKITYKICDIVVILAVLINCNEWEEIANYAEDEKDFLKTFLKLMGGILTSLRTIILLDNLGSIGQYSFGDCYSLQSITLGKNLRQIGFGAFQFCTSLTNITIPSQVESFEQTFANTGLTTVIMKERTQTISDFAFTNCKKLQNVTLPKSLVNIGANAFLGCSELKQIHLPQNVQTIINNYL